MMISTKGRYAVRIMLELAAHTDGELVPLSDIARHQQISLKYLEAIVAALKNAGLITGMRGKSGGYRLNRSPSDYTLREILTVTENGLVPVNCACLTGDGECERAEDCRVMPVWLGLDKVICEYLDGITLADID